ncbi:hypothetical protein TSUD_218130 [Trifolium subterraneum]|uniref:Uncharacterized protein n=1 Tax=Trifolium subterraneum TaxID=3900 RepID=A0A2Z6N9D5_TRISU|nr:hypothetical protein TSUD_218130 [Trifolium subterraneum]
MALISFWIVMTDLRWFSSISREEFPIHSICAHTRFLYAAVKARKNQMKKEVVV